MSDISLFLLSNLLTTPTFKYIGAGIAMIGVFGASIGQGYATGKAVEALGRNPETETKVRTMLIVGCAMTESAAIYCLIVAVLILFV